MSAIKTSFPSTHLEFDPATMHPASILSADELSKISERVLDRNHPPEEVHPAAIPSAARLIRDGFGELILRVKEGDTLRPVSKEEYARAYTIFKKYAPRLEEVPRPLEKSRIEMMREELRKIHPDMVATFIPRILHDLLFIRKAIGEDMERVRKFPFKDIGHPTKEEGRAFELTLARNSWCSTDATAKLVLAPGTKGWEREFVVTSPKVVDIRTPFDAAEFLPTLIDIGYRLNLAGIEEIERLGRNIEDLTFEQIQALVDDKIEFLKEFANNPNNEIYIEQLNCGLPYSISQIFRFSNAAIKRWQVSYFLKKAAIIECHESTIGKILAYRGGCVKTDFPLTVDSKPDYPQKYGKAYCISLGSALFPGIIHDIGACAYSFIRFREGYIVLFDPAKDSSLGFFLPPYTALESLFGDGEAWHYRFKVSRAEKAIAGVGGTIGLNIAGRDPESYFYYKSPLSREELAPMIQDLRKRVVLLKAEEN